MHVRATASRRACMHAYYFVWAGARGDQVAGDQSNELARRAYVYVGRGGARRGHARGDRPGRCECRRGAARTGQWWWPAGAARRPARQGGLPACPPLRAGRSRTYWCRPPDRSYQRPERLRLSPSPAIHLFRDPSLSSGEGPGLGGWLTDSASPAVVRGREARGHALIKAELPGVSRARGRAPESCCAPPPH